MGFAIITIIPIILIIVGAIVGTVYLYDKKKEREEEALLKKFPPVVIYPDGKRMLKIYHKGETKLTRMT